MSEYKEAWDDAYYSAREKGFSIEDAAVHADKEATNWLDHQIARAEAMEDR